MTLRVLVVDDHPLYRQGLTTAITTLPDVEVVGEAPRCSCSPWSKQTTPFSLPCEQARGYLLKGADRKEIARGLETVAAGEVVFGSAIASRVLGWFADRPRRSRRQGKRRQPRTKPLH